MTSPTPMQQLGGVAEISEMCNVPRTTVSMWDARRSPASGFPEPVSRLKMGPLYNLAEVKAWFDTKYPADAPAAAEES